MANNRRVVLISGFMSEDGQFTVDDVTQTIGDLNTVAEVLTAVRNATFKELAMQEAANADKRSQDSKGRKTVGEGEAEGPH